MVGAGLALARRLDPSKVTINSLHPGTMMPTKLTAGFGTSMDSLDSGVRAVERLVIDDELAGTTGQFFNRTRLHKASSQDEVSERLWRLGLDLTGGLPPQADAILSRG